MTNDTKLQILRNAIRWGSNMIVEALSLCSHFLEAETRQKISDSLILLNQVLKEIGI